VKDGTWKLNRILFGHGMGPTMIRDKYLNFYIKDNLGRSILQYPDR
jgi:hypothetical protein